MWNVKTTFSVGRLTSFFRKTWTKEREVVRDSIRHFLTRSMIRWSETTVRCKRRQFLRWQARSLFRPDFDMVGTIKTKKKGVSIRNYVFGHIKPHFWPMESIRTNVFKHITLDHMQKERIRNNVFRHISKPQKNKPQREESEKEKSHFKKKTVT